MPFINIKNFFFKIGLKRLILQANFSFLGNLKKLLFIFARQFSVVVNF